MTHSTPQGINLEIIQRTPDPDPDPSVVRPDEVWINGFHVAVPPERPVEIHGVRLDNDMVRVTLTMFVSTLTVSKQAAEVEA